jgi:hypothetical protein
MEKQRLSEDIDLNERNRFIVEVRQLQDEAFDLLVDEKLAVNKSCRMLITLSNDVLRQLDTTGTDDHLSDA